MDAKEFHRRLDEFYEAGDIPGAYRYLHEQKSIADQRGDAALGLMAANALIGHCRENCIFEELEGHFQEALRCLDVLELRQGKNKWSDNIRAQVDRMEHLVQDLIMMARLDEEQNEQALDSIELTALTEEIWHEYQPSLKQKDITGETALEETPPVKGSEALIRRMFCLLMDNAVQYTPEGGTIRLEV